VKICARFPQAQLRLVFFRRLSELYFHLIFNYLILFQCNDLSLLLSPLSSITYAFLLSTIFPYLCFSYSILLNFECPHPNRIIQTNYQCKVVENSYVLVLIYMPLISFISCSYLWFKLNLSKSDKFSKGLSFQNFQSSWSLSEGDKYSLTRMITGIKLEFNHSNSTHNFKLIKFPTNAWLHPSKIENSKRLLNLHDVKPGHPSKQRKIIPPLKSTDHLNLNCAWQCRGIKSLRKCQSLTTFELFLTSQWAEIKPCLTFNLIQIEIISQIFGLTDSNLDLLHYAKLVPSPHTNLKMENISYRLVDMDTSQYLDDSLESIEPEDLILEVSMKELNSESPFVMTMYKRVDKKIKPVPASFPEDCFVR